MIWILILSVVVAFLRPVFIYNECNKHVSQSYQAVAHILVGVLFTLWYVGTPYGPLALYVLLGLTIIEVVSAGLTALERRRIPEKQ